MWRDGRRGGEDDKHFLLPPAEVMDLFPIIPRRLDLHTAIDSWALLVTLLSNGDASLRDGAQVNTRTMLSVGEHTWVWKRQSATHWLNRFIK